MRIEECKASLDQTFIGVSKEWKLKDIPSGDFFKNPMNRTFCCSEEIMFCAFTNDGRCVFRIIDE